MSRIYQTHASNQSKLYRKPVGKIESKML